MTFTPTQKELFNKNIEALSNILLKESLKEIKSSKFELILGKDNLDINLKDTSESYTESDYSGYKSISDSIIFSFFLVIFFIRVLYNFPEISCFCVRLF